jgi:antirestriction protein
VSKLTTTTTEFDHEVESAGLNLEAFRIFLDNQHRDIDEDWRDYEDEFTDSYAGKFDSDREFAEHLVDDTMMLTNIPQVVARYFDYDSYARDLLHGDYWTTDNHYYRG